MKISSKPIHSLVGLPSFEHDFSDEILQNVRMIDKLIGESANFAQQPGLEGLLLGMSDMVAAAEQVIPLESDEKNMVLLKDMILMPITENPHSMMSFQILIVVILKRLLLTGKTNEIVPLRMAFLYELCASAKDTVLITTGETRRVGVRKVEPITSPVEYRMSEVIDFCIRPTKFDSFLDISLLGKYLSTDPYFIMSLPEAKLDPKDMVMFVAFKTIVSYGLAYFGNTWRKRLGEVKFRPFWHKLLEEKPLLVKKLIRFPLCPESAQFKSILGQQGLEAVLTMFEITDGVKEGVSRLVEADTSVGGDALSEKRKIEVNTPTIEEDSQLELKTPKLTEIPAPSMNFTIDKTTGVVMRPQGWEIPDGCNLEWKFWYMDDGQKKPLSPSEDHFSQKSLNDVIFSDELGQVFYGNICFSATFTAPPGSTFSSGTPSISSPELFFTKLRRIETPSMNFTIDENTGVVRVPEDWTLPDGGTISWTACYKGKKGKELVQAKDFQINEGILDISYQEGGEEVYGRLYVTVTLTAPKGSIFSSGTSSISSPELSCLRKAPELQATKPDAPQNVSAQSGGFGEIIVSFDAPVSNGGSPIMNYTVIASNGQKVTSANSPIMIKGLPGGKMYTFTVTATNSKGESNPSSASIPTLATLEAPTFKDTQAAWEIALGNPSDGLWYSIDEDNNIVVTLDDSLVGDRDNPVLDNLVYRTIIIDPHGVFDIGDILCEELSTSLRAYVGQIRQDIIEKEERRIERDKQNTIYHTLQDELHPCMEVLRGLAGTELATEKLNGVTLSQTFREKGVPMTNTVVRKKEKPAYKDILTLNFTERDVTATYSDGVVTFSGQGYTQGLEGIQRAYHDFREVITELGNFLFLTESQKSKKLQKLRAQRQALVGSFVNNLKSPKKTVNAQLIAVSDAMLVPSYMGDSVAHAGFPPDGSPDVRYVVVTRETLEAEYEKLRISIHGSGDAVKNKSISIMCLVRTGHIHINGDTGGDNKPYNVETVAANIESLRNSPQGRALLWDRIIATYGGTGTKIINGALKVLEEVKSIYDNILPTDEDTREEFIDDYLDELCREGILISYVRFSAVTIKEVREALKAQE